MGNGHSAPSGDVASGAELLTPSGPMISPAVASHSGTVMRRDIAEEGRDVRGIVTVVVLRVTPAADRHGELGWAREACSTRPRLRSAARNRNYGVRLCLPLGRRIPGVCSVASTTTVLRTYIHSDWAESRPWPRPRHPVHERRVCLSLRLLKFHSGIAVQTARHHTIIPHAVYPALAQVILIPVTFQSAVSSVCSFVLSGRQDVHCFRVLCCAFAGACGHRHRLHAGVSFLLTAVPAIRSAPGQPSQASATPG